MEDHILSIGYGRTLFTHSDGERARLARCAEGVGGFHAVIFSRSRDRLTHERVTPRFSLHPTSSLLRVFMLFDAYRIGRREMRAQKNVRWTITAQDPFMAGIVGYVLAKSTGFPFVIQEHGDFFSGYWERERMLHRLLSGVGRFLLRRASRVRAVSQRVKDHVVACGVLPERVVVLPVFTDCSAIDTGEQHKGLRAQYPDASVVVLSLARFVAQKNISMLIDAFAVLCAEDASARLVVVGRGPEEARIKKAIAARRLQESVTLLPWSDDVPSLMRSADIYALSSNYEGWGRVLVEAMCTGLPIVTTAVGCAGEVCKDGEHGLVVPVGDTAAFGEALARLAASPSLRAQFAHAGPIAARALFPDSAAYVRAWAEAHTMKHI